MDHRVTKFSALPRVGSSSDGREGDPKKVSLLWWAWLFICLVIL